MDGPRGSSTKLNKLEKDKYHTIHLYVEYKKMKQTQKQIHKYREPTDGCERGERSDKMSEVD